MVDKRHWHKRYHSDALTGYMGLSLELRGAYTTFLDLLYDRGEALVDNERLMAGYLNCSVRKYKSIRDQLVEMDKLILLPEGKITNKRFEKELENVVKTSRKRAESGAKGGDKSHELRKKINENKDGVQASATNEDKQLPLYARELEARSQSIDTSSTIHNSELNSEKERTIPTCPKPSSDEGAGSSNHYPQDFEIFWKLYSRKNDKKHSAYQSWMKAIKATSPEAICKAADAYLASMEPDKRHGPFQMMAATWLNQKCYLDDFEPHGSKSGSIDLSHIPDDEKPWAISVAAFKRFGKIDFKLWSQFRNDNCPPKYRQQLESIGFTGAEHQAL